MSHFNVIQVIRPFLYSEGLPVPSLRTICLIQDHEDTISLYMNVFFNIHICISVLTGIYFLYDPD